MKKEEKNEKTSSEMEKLLLLKDQPQLPKVGDLVKGKVISVSKSEVHLDIDGITTGVVRGRELIDESGEYSNIKIGDLAQATVLEMENESGQIELSFRSAGHQKAWDELKKMMEDGKVIEALISAANRGGLLVEVGRISGFLPVSQLMPEHYPRVEGGDKNKIMEKLSEFIGKKLKVKIIDVDESDNKLIVSEKAAWEKEQQKVISGYKAGDIVEGRVTGVVDFGAFIEFGAGLEGLIHISELAWQRIDDPREIIRVGEKVKAEIISIDGTKISLSIKKLKEDPWKKAVQKYKIGEIVSGKVIKLNPFGAFVELDKDIHGLVHISELSDKLIAHPGEILKVDENYKFKILSIEPENHRLGLSARAIKEKSKPAAEQKSEDRLNPPKADQAEKVEPEKEKTDVQEKLDK
jgi:small subunit ribosomal protein S1